MRIAQEKLDALLARLCEQFPQAFFAEQAQRRPLKLGIHRDILAALGDAIDPKDLSIALRIYTANPVYLQRQTAGVARIDLDGNHAGVVSAEEAANAQRMLLARVAKQKAAKVEKPKAEKPPPVEKLIATKVETEPSKPRRLGLADLKAAALKRKVVAA